MHESGIIFSIFLIFTGAAALATLFLYARQSLIVAYILLGMLAGPAGFGLVDEPELVSDIANIGIIFLLYLLGLNLYPQKLVQMLREATTVTLVSAVVFLLLGFVVALIFGFPWTEALLIGAACVFSSTILGLKLLPTTALHHRHAGEIIISVLLIQDMIAILLMVLLQGFGSGDAIGAELLKLILALPAVVAVAFLIERYVIANLLHRFDRISEYTFLLAIGWSLGIAQLAAWAGLSYEIGAFIAGVTLAASPVARYIAESLKPLRDFFLVIFFFSLGAAFEIQSLTQILIPTLVLVTLLTLLKPVVFRFLLVSSGETPKLSWEMGVRLGSGSEFSLLIAVIALETGFIGAQASYLIQAMTLLTFLVSSYLIVLIYPTPIAASDRLRQD